MLETQLTSEYATVRASELSPLMGFKHVCPAVLFKRCTKCKKVLAISEFQKDRNRPDGLQCWCKICMKGANKTYHQTLTGRNNGRLACSRYLQTPKGKQYHCNKTQRYYSKYPEKHDANHAINYAVKIGQCLSPINLKCQHCGKQAKEYHHPNGYEREHWFDVIPLCRSCHIKAHQQLKDEGE
jgi:phage FluMu protein Com